MANVIDPAKLTTLKERGANSHARKAVYWLAAAELEGEKSSVVMDAALHLLKTAKPKAKLTQGQVSRRICVRGGRESVL